MSKILIISATSDKNLELANELQALLTAMGTDSGLVVLDKLNLPLYSDEAEIESGVVEEIIEKMKHASGFIFCAPEYNGSDVTYIHLRAHETEADLVCRLLLEKK